MASVHNRKYDVFVSFRGSDIRHGFLSHLHKALLDHNIEAFVDEELERGKEISASLLGKIEESHMAIVIFSQNYAYSEWCLDELLKIEECRKTAGQIVIPVFYRVDPSHVQELTGSYGDAMAQHRKNFDESLVESWGHVLMGTATVSGFVYSNFKNESNLIEEIIIQALETLNCLYPSDSDCDGGLIGINSRVEKVISLLCGSEDVGIVGIWGEGGIGKTNLAQAAFDRICLEFDIQCFVGNVREKSEKFTTDAIRNEVFSKLFGTNYSDMTRKRFSRKKVILVLDDVSEMDQIKSIMRYRVDVGRGSRIIVTSRDSHLLKNLGAKIYAVEKLDDHEALQLFCLSAFNMKIPRDGYLELSKRAVKHTQGLPLALEVLGYNLSRRSAEEWEDELEKLKGTSDKKIHTILRRSYEGLSDVEKEIFLDIACCFKGRMRHEVERILDARGSKIGISRLAEKALISLSSDNRLSMHELVEQMAKDIICEKKPEKRRWLWDPEEIYFLLSREMGTEAVRGITLDMSKIRNMNLSPTAFVKLYNLRYLNFYSSRSDKAQLCVPRGLEYLPQQLRYLYWDQYPSNLLQLTSILAEKLVGLQLCNSQLEELWNGIQNLPNIEWIDLRGSTKLIKVPDLSRASNLKSLDLSNCSSLESLPDNIFNLKSLSLLDVSSCENLHQLPQNFGNLQSLERFRAAGSGIKVVPSSINNLRELTDINFSGCKGLILPHLTGAFPHLINIDLTGCGISEFPVALCSVTSLVTLNMAKNNFEGIPKSVHNLLKLHTLGLNDCKKLKYLPETIKLLPLLGHLTMTECTSLDLNHCSEIIDSLVMAYIKDKRRLYFTMMLWYPGSVIPEKMRYRNEFGSSVSFSFKLLQHAKTLVFYVCVVLDMPEFDIAVKGSFTDESGLDFVAFGDQLNSRGAIQSKHVASGPTYFRSGNFIQGCQYTAEIQFQATLFANVRILKCGVIPLFDHETVKSF